MSDDNLIADERFTIRLPKAQLEAIQQLAPERTITDITREALKLWVEANGGAWPDVPLTPPGKRKGAGRKSKPSQ